ncbi:MAG: ferrochelatase [Acidobacteriota bacterium]
MSAILPSPPVAQSPGHEPKKTTPTAVLVMNYGGPEGPGDCEPYLRNIFLDPDLIPIPALLRPLLARIVARRRAPKLRAIYGAMGRYSPTLEETRAQARGLEAILGEGFRCFVGMRYWRPSIAETCREVAASGASRLVLLPLYPQESGTTTGSAFREARRALREAHFAGEVFEIPSFHREEGYLAAMAARIEEALEGAPPRSRALFSAHGLPLSVARRDPYPGQVLETVAALCERTGLACGRLALEDPPVGPFYGPGEGRMRAQLAWQSKVGPARWLQPSVEAVLARWAQEGVAHAVAVPVAFVNEHSETLYELDVLYAGRARELGLTFRRAATVGTAPAFLGALAGAVRRVLGGEGAP